MGDGGKDPGSLVANLSIDSHRPFQESSGKLQVWDRRSMGRRGKPEGSFVGHCEGVTHLDPKGDGRYFISNAKDQTVKLWDLRRMTGQEQMEK